MTSAYRINNPNTAKPITRWQDRDEAFQVVVGEINRSIKKLLISLKIKEERVKEGYTLSDFKSYEEALAAHEQAIRLDPVYAYAYHNKGGTLYNLKRYKEALTAFEQAIHFDPNNADAYEGKGYALNTPRSLLRKLR